MKVDEGGDTTVSVQTGPPVRVRAENKTQPVSLGQTVKVAKGQPPPAPELILSAPQPRTPNDGSRFSSCP